MQTITWGAMALVAAGGAAGSVLRYVVGMAALEAPGGFPWGTLGINVAGSFVLGAVLGALPAGHTGRLLFGTGFCGGFTTYSTFSAEVVTLVGRGAHGRASAYVLASVALSVLAAAAGAALGRAMGSALARTV